MTAPQPAKQSNSTPCRYGRRITLTDTHMGGRFLLAFRTCGIRAKNDRSPNLIPQLPIEFSFCTGRNEKRVAPHKGDTESALLGALIETWLPPIAVACWIIIT